MTEAISTRASTQASAANAPSPRGSLAFSHVGFFVTNLPVMERFYTHGMDFTVTDRGELDTAHGRLQFVFLSRDPNEHHQIVLATGRPPDLAFNAINQISLRADSLQTLRNYHDRALAYGASNMVPVTHGNAVSIYFFDPEGNRIELFIDTPWYVDQPMRVPVDLKQPDDVLWPWLEKHARALPGFVSRDVWRDDLARRMAVTVNQA